MLATWQLLCCMAAHPRRLLHKDDLMTALWPGSVVVADSLTQCVVELRRALGDHDRRMVRTVPRRGFRFDVELSPLPCVTRGVSLPERAQATSDDIPCLDSAWALLRRMADREQVALARCGFERELQNDSSSAEALTGIALSHVVDLLNRWSGAPRWQTAIAREAADRALSLAPGYALAHHARAHVALIEGCHFEAWSGFRRALALDPSLGRAHLRIAIIRLELGHAEAAAEHLREALGCTRAASGFEAQVRFTEGMVAFHLGRDEEAMACLNRSIALSPESGFAHQWHAVIDALRGQDEAAAAHLARFREQTAGHTIESLQATERSSNPIFRQQRDRFYEGLRRAGMPR